MNSLGELRSAGEDEHKVQISSAEIELHLHDEERLPLGDVTVVINGGPGRALQMFLVGSKSDHVIFAVEDPVHKPLYFVAYKLVDSVWRQLGHVVIDPEGNLREVVKAGVYDPVQNVHRHFLRCCA